MKKYFIASLCRNGILGGGIHLDDDAVTYKTGKVTVSAKYKNLQMPYEEIVEISKGWLLCFPTVTLQMKDGEAYKFNLLKLKPSFEMGKNMTIKSRSEFNRQIKF